MFEMTFADVSSIFIDVLLTMSFSQYLFCFVNAVSDRFSKCLDNVVNVLCIL